jgi:hypothetical protein
MTAKPTPNLGQYVPLVKIFFAGFLVGSLIVGGLGLNAVLLTFLIIALLLLSRGADILPALIAVVLGAAVVILFRQLSFAALDTNALILCCVAVILL